MFSIDTPTNFEISQSENSFFLSWEGVRGAELYTIYHSSDSNNGPWSLVDNTTSTTMPYTNEVFGPGLHHFCVTASNANKESEYSSSVSITIVNKENNTEDDNESDDKNENNENNDNNEVTDVPDVPDNIRLEYKNGALILSWDTVKDATEYVVNYSFDKEEWFTTTVKTNSYSVETEYPDIYYFTVTAVNSAGESKASDIISYKQDDENEDENDNNDNVEVPNTPGGINIEYNNGVLLLSWDTVPNATEYNVYYSFDTEEWFKTTVSTNSYSVETEYPEIYYFAISAINSAGESETTEIISFNKEGDGDQGEDDNNDEATDIPETPTGLTGYYSEGVIHLSWNPVEGATEYIVYFTIDSENYYNRSVTTNSFSLETEHPEYYSFAVSAVNSAGESKKSELFSLEKGGNDDDNDGTTQSPKAPSSLTGSRSGNYVTVQWSSVAGATSYNVYYSHNTPANWILFDTTSKTNITFKDSNKVYVAVKAVNSYGESELSKYVTIQEYNDNGGNDGGNDDGGNDDGSKPEKPSAPTGVTANWNGSVTAPSIAVSWDYSNEADSYKIYRSTSASGSYSYIGQSNSTSYYDYSPKEGNNYYKVTAVNSAGESAKSDYAVAEYDPYAAKPGTPKWGNCTVSGMNMTLRWSIPKGKGIGVPDKILVRARGFDGKTYTVKELSGTSTSHTFNISDYLWFNDGNECQMVYVGIVAENEYGSEASTTKVYNYTEKEWVN